MKTILKNVKDDMRLKRYSVKTINTYYTCLAQYLQYFNGREYEEIESHEIKQYLLTLVDKGYSRSTQNQAINSIKYYYEKILKRPREVYYIERPRKARRIPAVLSIIEFQRLIQCVKNMKHKTMLLLVYSCGLRAGELLNLQVRDIDGKRFLVNVREGKGVKDRIIPLSKFMLQVLREYYKTYRPGTWLFESPNKEKYSYTSLSNIMRKASVRAKITKNVSLHTLRHSYATHMLDSGIDIRYIQEILGHSSIMTTEIYTHVTTKDLQKLTNPLDLMVNIQQLTGLNKNELKLE